MEYSQEIKILNVLRQTGITERTESSQDLFGLHEVPSILQAYLASILME